MWKAMNIIKNEKSKLLKEEERHSFEKKSTKADLDSIIGEVKSFVHEFEV